MLFSLGAVVVIVGGYLTFRYSSIVPRLFHQEKTVATTKPVGSLRDDTLQPLAVQSPQYDDGANTSNASASISTTTQTPPVTISPPPTSSAMPVAANPAPTLVLQQNSLKITSTLQQVTQQTQTTVKSLLNSITGL
jgi:hypothetical protein